MQRMPDDQAQFFQRLRLCAERSGWLVGGKYHGLAAALPKLNIMVTPDTVRAWFLGKQEPEPSTMAVLATLLRINPQWLSTGTGDPLKNVGPKPLLSGPEQSHIPVLTPELCYDWVNYLPVPTNLPRLTVYRLTHPRTFAYLVRQRKPAGKMRPQRHIIVSPLETRMGHEGKTLTVVCDQRKFHIGHLEKLGSTHFLLSPDHDRPPLRLSFSHQIVGYIDPETVARQPVIPGPEPMAI